MQQKDELMGIPQLIHFNAMLITGALFIGILLAEYMTTDNSKFVIGLILLLSLSVLSFRPRLVVFFRIGRYNINSFYNGTAIAI